MTDRTQDTDAMSFEDLLACPHLDFDVRGEVLPHLLAFGPPSGASADAPAPVPALARRPWLYDPTTSTTAACG